MIEGTRDGLEGLKIDVHALLLTLIGHNGTTIDHKTVGGNLAIQLQLLLSGSDSTLDRQSIFHKSHTSDQYTTHRVHSTAITIFLPVDTRLDVGSSTVFTFKHLVNTGYNISRGNDERNHTGTVSIDDNKKQHN
jgi:hypothetical protein